MEHKLQRMPTQPGSTTARDIFVRAESLLADIFKDEYRILHECHLVWHKFCTPWRLTYAVSFGMADARITIVERRG